ncbi:MAG: DMT family transporter [Pseudomonadota bacterium]|nr:DMT family transporter [Pseudomonadota bacterium]MEC7660457.1 DMT family transporter [Pseudomonadota bacterium]
MIFGLKNFKKGPSSLRGVLCMLGGALSLTINDAMAKYLTQSYPVGQVMALRGLSIIMLLIAFLFFMNNLKALKIFSWKGHLLRAGAMTGSTFFFITGLSLLPITDAIAIAFVAPILTTILGIIILREAVSWKRWVAIFVGFFGVIIILQPTSDAFKIAAIAPMGAAAFGAARDVVTRAISGSENSLSILFTSMLMITIAGFLTYPLGWSAVKLSHIWIFITSSLLVGLAQYLMIEAFRLGEVALISPFKYSSLLWATLISLVIWDDLPSKNVVLGAFILILSGIYLLKNEVTNGGKNR